MRKNWPKITLGFILVLAAFLRLFSLERFPAGFTADEAAQGYTAYSILKTGKDEWGVELPLNPRSFGDYKPALQTYLMIPSIAVFGLNEFAVRLPNAILGVLSVVMVYLLAKELFASSSTSQDAIRQPPRFLFGLPSNTSQVSLALVSSFLLAVSPWHISLSRGAFEANLTTFFMPLGFWLFLKGLKKPKYLVLASVFFGLNLFTYHAAKLVMPLLVGVLGIWGRRGLRRVRGERRGRREIVFGGVIFALFMLLAFGSALSGGGTRAADIGIFSAGLKAPKLFLDNYFSYLSLRFLFTQGAGEATYGMIPGRGVLYLFELPFLIFALYSLTRKWDRNFLPVLVWIVLSPVPAALSLGVGYHANRAAVMMPAIQILSAYGGVILWERVEEGLKGKKGIKRKIYAIALLLYCPITLLSFVFFLKAYFMDAPKVGAPAMSYGWRETMMYLKTQEANYEKIIISRRFSEPQAFMAFYSQYDPGKFQQESQNWLRYEKEGLLFVDQLGSYSLGKYEFRNLNFSDDKNLNKLLLMGRPEEFPSDTTVQKMIVYPDGQRAFWMVDTGKR